MRFSSFQMVKTFLGQSFKQKTSTALSFLAAAGLATAVAAPRASHAGTDAEFIFKYTNDLTAKVKLKTSSLTPLVPGTIYDIIGIEGELPSPGGATITGLTIDPLNPGFIPKFKYDPLAIETNLDGIYFDTSDTLKWNIYFSQGASSYGVADQWYNNSIQIPNTGTIIVPGTPAPPAPTVPGPLPIFGATAAFGMSRRLKRRVKAAA